MIPYMLKRKSGNSPQHILRKKLKRAKRKTHENKYEQKTISQTLSFLPKSSDVQKFSFHPREYGLISSYLKEYKKRVKCKIFSSEEKEKTILIQGPPGCGKTYFVRQIADDLKLKILELNTSSHRSKGQVCKILGEACQTFAIDQGGNKGTIVFIDDVDIELEPDKGFYKGIESIILTNKCPVIMTCSEIPENLTSQNKIKVYRLECYKEKALEYIEKVINSEMIPISRIELENIYIKANGNLNKIFTYLCTRVKFN